MSLSYFLFIICFLADAQHNNELYNDGALIYLQPGAEVHVWGDVHMMGASGNFENNGYILVQGNMYSDHLFQQRGTGTTLLQNSNVNIGERQFISGSYAVRGGSGQIGVDDGSFYNLKINNDQRIVYLINTGAGSNPQYVADVRNTINFNPSFLAASEATNIVTADIGTTGVINYPSNGASYTAEFGMMNSSAGLSNYINDTWHTGGNNSSQDNGYIIGKHRRSIDLFGGSFGFLVGLAPDVPVSDNRGAKGFQYIQLNLDFNFYDVITAYFQSGSPNNAVLVDEECTGFLMDSYWGEKHGEWGVTDINGASGYNYVVKVWPQDPIIPWSGIAWGISKDNILQGATDDCGGSPLGLSRGGFSDFNGTSEFGLVSGTIFTGLPIVLLDITATGKNDYIDIVWNVASEINVSHYEVERSVDGKTFEKISDLAAYGDTSGILKYSYSDYNIKFFQDYYYRIKNIDYDGAFDYTPLVVANIKPSPYDYGEGSFSIFPNPTSGNSILGIYLENNSIIQIIVFNAFGQIVAQHEKTIEKGKTVFQLPSDQWDPGIYYIQSKDVNSNRLFTKLLIKK